MSIENPKLTDIARQLGAQLYDFQQEKRFGATELQNIIFDLSGKESDGLGQEIWLGYMKRSGEHEQELRFWEE